MKRMAQLSCYFIARGHWQKSWISQWRNQPSFYGWICRDWIAFGGVIEKTTVWKSTLSPTISSQGCRLMFGSPFVREKYLPMLAIGRTLAPNFLWFMPTSVSKSRCGSSKRPLVYLKCRNANKKMTSPVRIATKEEMEAKYNRVVTSSLLAYLNLLSSLGEKCFEDPASNKQDDDKSSCHERLLEAGKFWKMAACKNIMVSTRCCMWWDFSPRERPFSRDNCEGFIWERSNRLPERILIGFWACTYRSWAYLHIYMTSDGRRRGFLLEPFLNLNRRGNEGESAVSNIFCLRQHPKRILLFKNTLTDGWVRCWQTRVEISNFKQLRP